jgi:hypothetical protein
MSGLLPTFCSQTRTRHADRSFCVYCGGGEEYQHLFLAQSSQASFPSQAPLPELAPVLGAQSAPIEVSDSPLAIRLNPLTPSHKRVAEASREPQAGVQCIGSSYVCPCWTEARAGYCHRV